MQDDAAGLCKENGEHEASVSERDFLEGREWFSDGYQPRLQEKTRQGGGSPPREPKINSRWSRRGDDNTFQWDERTYGRRKNKRGEKASKPRR